MNTIKLATENRKAAAQRLAEITGETSRYTKVPRCAFQVGPFFFEKDGTVTVTEDADLQPLRTLVDEGILEPFDDEPVSQEAPAETETDVLEETPAEEGLTVSMPIDGFTDSAIDNLKKLIEAKGRLIKKAVAADRLDLEIAEDRVSFPWWSYTPEAADTQAYLSLITALCAMAKEATRVTAKDTEVESEKYAFRTFLLRLGFVGAENKAQRKLLMRRLSGSSAFRNQEEADKFSAAQKAKRDAAKAGAAAEVTA